MPVPLPLQTMAPPHMIPTSLISFAFYILFYPSRCFGSVDQIGNLSLYHSMRPWLLLSTPFTLEPRQELQCQFPGGPTCSATTCCRPGQHCCPLGCCNDADNCEGNNMCCPENAQTCGGKTCCESGGVCCSSSPTGCCVPNAVCCGSSITPCCPQGSTCCGNSCCPAGETCERGECIDASLNITRFVYDEEVNGDLLRNMCNGMRGKNTQVLTYSGSQSRSQKAAKRRAAGCKPGYCASLLRQGLITDKRLNSCDEYPPASTEEGGASLYQGIQRTFNCVPGVQNSWQGTQFRRFGFGTRGPNGIKKYEKVVISIDCDKVLGSFLPPQSAIAPRDIISQSGNQSNVHYFSPNDTTGFLIVPFGDLEPGTYSSSVQLISGSTINATLIDSYGDNYTADYPGLQQGGGQQFNFTLEDEGAGMGLVFFTTTNSTSITWSLGGTTFPSSSISGSSFPTGVTSSNISWRVVVNAHFLVLGCIAVSLSSLL